jgi:L-threonylcarbamoyladenylate synthase
MTIRILPPTPAALAQAAALLKNGDLVAFPTETVYGLGADATADAAVQKIYTAKGRPPGNPLIVHLPTADAARALPTVWPEAADRLAAQFWPGPLTLILPRKKGALSPLVSAGRTTVALRCPNHPVAQQLLRAADLPIAAPSANRSGFTSPTAAAHVYAELAGRIPLILDGNAAATKESGGRGGDCHIGLESTVLDLSTGTPTVLRPGAITLEMLRALLPSVQLATLTVNPDEAAASPGLHSRHYAPRTPAFRFTLTQWPHARHFADAHTPVALITYNDHITLPAPHHTLLLPHDEPAYARNLYAALRDADALHAKSILLLSPPADTGLWLAITDRLRRATQPLPEGTEHRL